MTQPDKRTRTGRRIANLGFGAAAIGVALAAVLLLMLGALTYLYIRR
ncbi:hypothetical protein AB0H83_45795 [Dactylosporangium sp. NPDC050688]